MSDVSRRDAIKLLAAAAMAGCTRGSNAKDKQVTGKEAILNLSPLGMPWRGTDPFLMCVHHDDHYPMGNQQLGPAASLAGRQLGMDFAGKDGWSMYHGTVVPGFPQHPHRGFETVTVVRQGLLDHSDSMGAAARYGQGDVQWLTAGGGILHAEMFPLLNREAPNHVELFQIWLNLPRKNKMVEPHFLMLWGETIPRHTHKDASGGTTEVVAMAGRYGEVKPLPTPPESWASEPGSELAIWTIKMAPKATWTLPASAKGVNRSLYVFRGGGLRIAGEDIPNGQKVELRAEYNLALENGAAETEILLLQGRPIGEPVVQHGPFVMTSQGEIRQAFIDYQSTQFGGWPWPRADFVHPREEGRFARHADGRIERPV